MNKTINMIGDLAGFFSEVLPPQEKGQVFVAATPFPKRNADDKPPMRHIHAATHYELADAVLQTNSEGKDAYYALGRFTPHKTAKGNPGRQGGHVQGLKAFWLDIDVGVAKSVAGLGYATKEDAINAITDFVRKCGLPFPTHIIVSGGGIHAYWALDKIIHPEEWKPVSLMLKEKATELNFLVDPARTTDVASILRPPRTQNHKLIMPRDVELIRRKLPIEFSKFANAIGAAYAKHRGTRNAATPPCLGTTPPNLNLGTNTDPVPIPETPEKIEYVKSMLAVIPANCARDTWRDLVWAVADTGWEYAEELAREWSKTAPEKYDESDFNQAWRSFDPKKEGGVKFGTLIHHAKQHGWNDAGINKNPIPSWVEEINQNYAWIEKGASIYRLEFDDFIKPSDFKTQFENQSVPIPSGNYTKSVGKGTAWIKHPNRRQHRQLVFAPNEDLVTLNNCLNEWHGFAIDSKPGDIEPFLNLVHRLVPNQKANQYVLSWMAHLLKHPHIKMNVSLAFWSHKQGVGKNLLFQCLSSIIGSKHATLIGQSELARDFNSWANRKILVIGDEVSGTNRRQDSDKLKGLVTGTTLHINEKNIRAYEVPNLINFIFLSNHHDALFLDAHDRRFFVWEVTDETLPDALAQEFVKWRDNGGLSALFDYLLNYDISKFNPKAPAPMTAAKQQMLNDNRSDLESWIADLIGSDASQALGREIVTAQELASYYAHETDNMTPSPKAVTSACKRLGAYTRPNQVRSANGKKVRALALNRPEYWKQQTEAVWATELKKPLQKFFVASQIVNQLQGTPQMCLVS